MNEKLISPVAGCAPASEFYKNTAGRSVQSSQIRIHNYGLGYLLGVYFILINFAPGSILAQAESSAHEQALVAADRGDYRTSIDAWSQLIESEPSNFEARLSRGEAYVRLGYLPSGIADLERALLHAESTENTMQWIMAATALGYAQYRNQAMEKAESNLLSARQQAVELKRWGLAAAAANRLGNLYADREDLTLARQHMKEAINWAQETNNPDLEVVARLNALQIGMTSNGILPELSQTRKQIEKIASSYVRAELLLRLGVIAQQYKEVSFSYNTLSDAVDLAKKTENRRLHAEALSRLAGLYDSQGRYVDALSLTESAVNHAQTIQASELMLQLEWRRGRLLEELGDLHRALDAYRRAVDHTQSVRGDIPVRYQGGRSSFRDTLGPLYLDLADLLITESTQANSPGQIQSLLAEVQQTIELFNTAELQDYFRDACIAQRSPKVGLYALSEHTAVLYPIIFPERLELLLGVREHLQRYVVDVTQQELEQTVHAMEQSLWLSVEQQMYPFDVSSAKSLYKWLISPLEKVLEQEQVDTIVFVPHGVLRTIPLTALRDGDEYLVQRYAVATVPGLTLLDPNPLIHRQIRLLAAGLSHPGTVVQELPSWMVEGLLELDSSSSRGLNSRALPEAPLKNRSKEVRLALQQPMTIKRLQDALSLPGVISEIQKITKSLPSTTLQDDDFLLSNFERELAKPYRIVHIASHGIFTGDPDESFIMTSDRILNMQKLDELMRPEALEEQPVELLTLSACQTAQGDDRSPLGLAGVALKSGARSVLGSLWPVSDEAAEALFPEFYEELQKPNVTKAKALQHAQLKLLRQNKFSHPFFWAPFLLVGNWL